MNNNIKITYPSSEKVYMNGVIHPELKVGMRKVTLTPTVTIEKGEKHFCDNAPV
ncbi:MAG: phosphomethylpyrimidine synthase, partial [Prevotella sp.]|nr:phosphomethylpyrimidine synthase [Prevotella sp.]